MAGYGDVIRRLRRERNLNQEQLAEMVGVDRELISRAESSGNVGILSLYGIADALNVKVSAFFGRVVPSDVPPWWSKVNAEQRKRLERLVKAWLEED